MLRRELIKKYLGFIGLIYILPGCGDSDSPPATPMEEMELCSTNGPASVIGTNHSHTITIPAADIVNETPGTFELTIGAAHTHTLSLTLAEIQSLKMSGSLVKDSSNDAGHSHSVTITCVG